MATHRVGLTYEDYSVLPNDGRRYEIYGGELSVTPAPSPRHQDVLANLHELVRRHVRDHGLVILANTTIVQPDLIYLAPAQASRVSARGIEGAPTLAVEILSPSTGMIDRSTKLQLYARDTYRLVARAAGDTPVSLPPFPDLAFVPDSLWP